MIEQGKKELVYEKNVLASKLLEELYAAFPEYAPSMDSDRKIIVHFRLFTKDRITTLWVPEDLEPAAVDKVVDEHENRESGEIDADATLGDE